MTARSLAARVEAVTPAGRDRSIDALRALAIAGVVLGHWLVTAFVVTEPGLRVASPLSYLPALAPLSWLLQTLAVFFFVGGYAAARGLPTAGGYREWLLARMNRLFRPALALVAFWAVAALIWMPAIDGESARAVWTIVLSPLWFLVVYAGLLTVTPLVLNRPGRLVVPLVTAVVAVDVARFGLGGPAWLGGMNVPTAWLVPFCLGVACARGARLPAVGLLVGGTAATAVLMLWFGYPASLVGVPGQSRSNLNPPALVAVTFGLAQVGLAVLLRGPLTRLVRRPLAWAVVALANLWAVRIFLWHQTALVAVTMFALGHARLAGLHTAPETPWWILPRLGWLPIFALVLLGGLMLGGRIEASRRPGSGTPAARGVPERNRGRSPERGGCPAP
ncbi:acyltransferase [Micromonospora gifhornensis]|uniref:Acyltransferase n=1 Tax=Micromonospora gifhornensis TaxID=84594 RepID=A0ABQ4IHC5_9ACTN|nr:acyltransferase [Micromonospora gifhornensis]GIJ17308.1 acyltransferase [Micromonospora gifhornensis]